MKTTKYTYENVPLRNGDFVNNLTENQYLEIVKIGTRNFTTIPDEHVGFNPANTLCWFGSERTNELEYEEFIRRYKNNFN